MGVEKGNHWLPCAILRKVKQMSFHLFMRASNCRGTNQWHFRRQISASRSYLRCLVWESGGTMPFHMAQLQASRSKEPRTPVKSCQISSPKASVDESSMTAGLLAHFPILHRHTRWRGGGGGREFNKHISKLGSASD